MADFKIKPATGTGNKLILQTEDATDVLTTSDSGVTLASATLNSPTLVTPALGTPASGVVTNLSGVLPVGVTGGSGLTALGTVTAGNLSNTAIVYPAGHVLQVGGTAVNYNYGSLSNSNENHCTWIDVTLTTKGANSDFFVIGRVAATRASGTAFGVGIGFRYVATGSSEVTASSCHEYENYDATPGSPRLVASHQMYIKDATIAKGIAVTFRVYMEFNNANGGYEAPPRSGAKVSSHTVMEVQT